MKVLIIAPFNLNVQNGTSNYANKITNICLKLNIKVTFYYYLNNNFIIENWEIKDQNFQELNLNVKRIDAALVDETLIKEHLSEIKNMQVCLLDHLKNSNYDLILDLSTFSTKEMMRKDNYFYIQQMQINWFDKHCDNIHFFNPIIYAKNLVLFDKYQLKQYNDSQNYFCIPLGSFTKDFILENKKEILRNLFNKFNGNIVYIGRINNQEKNVGLLSDLNSFYDLNIDIYGPNQDNLEVNNYKHALNREEVVSVIKKAKYMILVSKTEGFGYSLVEAISLGTPIIVLNTFESASFLTSNHNGFLLDKNCSLNELSVQISQLKNLDFVSYKQLVNNCFEFALNTLSLDKFEEKWVELLTKKAPKK